MAKTTTKRMCDFCSGGGEGRPAEVYFPCYNFEVPVADIGDQVSFPITVMSGDRFYACYICRRYVEDDDFNGLARHVANLNGYTAFAGKSLWPGFRQNRAGHAVGFAFGTDPEHGRKR